jgi:hypothetical protein
MILTEEKQTAFTKTFPGATTTNPQWVDSDCNSGLRGKRPSTYSLNHDTYLLTPWSRVLLEKLTGLQLVKKFLTFYGTRRFITALTSAHHLSLS